jgi:hypothetical protein
MKKPFLISFLGFVFLLASTAAYSQKIETIDGVRVVHNVKGGQWGKNPQVSIKLFQTIGDLNTEDENLAFNSPSDIAMDAAGNIYILDSANQRIQKFSPEGKYLATIGRKGQGPGEFNYPSSLDIDGQGNFYVLDPFVKKIQVLSSQGKEQKTIRVIKDTIFEARFSKTGLFAAGIYPGMGSKSEEEQKNKELQRLVKLYDQAGTIQKEFGLITDYGDSMSNYYGNIFRLDIDQDGNVYLSFWSQNRVEKYSADGHLLWKADRPLNYETGIKEKEKRVNHGGAVDVTPPRMNAVSAGITADEKRRAWVATLNRQMKKEEEVSTLMVGGGGGISKVETKGNRDLQTTDMYKLEIFSAEGILLGEIPLNQFVSHIRIIKDNLFLIDSEHGAKIYQYKIIEK